MKVLLAACLGFFAVGVVAEVTSSSDTHYLLRHKGRSSLAVHSLWERLVEPSTWWSPDHSYSGDAENLSLDLRPGGYWLESWAGGSVAHGRVLLIEHGKTLRLEAPFGPLQGLGAYVVWTISLEPDDGGTRVTFTESAVGPAGGALHAIAPAVDAVKSEAMARLVAPGSP